MWKWRFICWLIRKITRPERLEHRYLSLLEELQHNLDEFGDNWTVYSVRPKTPLPPIAMSDAATQIGIVIQGKVATKDDFTRRTVEHYGRTFPGSQIFVSTWNDEPVDVLRPLEQAGATVLLNERPEFPAPCHLNYQIRSTLAGVQAVREAGCQYVLKTRTDTRMYAGDVADFLTGLVEQFPAAPGYGVNRRIAVLDYATRMLMPHHPADLMMFGDVADMERYWSAPFCQQPKSADRVECPRFSDVLASVIPEVYLCRHYLDAIGYAHEETITSWWVVLADLFVVVDRAMIGHFWPKYNYAMDHCSSIDQHLRNEVLCSFREWMGIYRYRKTPHFRVEDLAALKPNGLLPRAA